MATTKIQMTTSCQLVVADAKNFIVDNQSSYDVEVTFASSAPATNAPFHVLKSGEGLIRLGVSGALYARDNDPSGAAFLVVSAED